MLMLMIVAEKAKSGNKTTVCHLYESDIKYNSKSFDTTIHTAGMDGYDYVMIMMRLKIFLTHIVPTYCAIAALCVCLCV